LLGRAAKSPGSFPREEFDDLTVIYFSVEYIYVVQKFRMRGLGKWLLEPLIYEVHEAVHEATNVDAIKRVYLSSASHPENSGGTRLLKRLETRVCRFASARNGVALLGRYIEQPAGIARALAGSSLMV